MSKFSSRVRFMVITGAVAIPTIFYGVTQLGGDKPVQKPLPKPKTGFDRCIAAGGKEFKPGDPVLGKITLSGDTVTATLDDTHATVERTTSKIVKRKRTEFKLFTTLLCGRKDAHVAEITRRKLKGMKDAGYTATTGGRIEYAGPK
ncbi:MAG: hypothetical protein K2Q32_07465 [Alphaproteobacteria bacterium]|nr:hypothetical protein [Alphaproteobacteria bacterium]